jgi:hypothetical protein
MTTPGRTRLADPANSAEWLDVANKRLSDARALAQNASAPVASAYLAGYAIECALKAHLDSVGKSRPRAGGEGHNLRALWAACELVLRDLADLDGSKNYFVTDWSTDLRYQAVPNTQIEPEKLVQGAGMILGRIRTQIRRNSQRRR